MSLFKKIREALSAKEKKQDDKSLQQGPVIHKPFQEEPTALRQLRKLHHNKDERINQKLVKNDLKCFMQGHAGERRTMYELKESDLPISILHDIQIETKDSKAQIDFVIVTTQFILLLEAKHLVGNLHVNEAGDFIRTDLPSSDGRKEGLKNPVSQVERQRRVLEKALYENEKVSALPIYTVVTFANDKTVIDYADNAPISTKKQVCRADQIANYIFDLLQTKTDEVVNMEEAQTIAEQIAQLHQEQPFKTQKYYGLHHAANEHANTNQYQKQSYYYIPGRKELMKEKSEPSQPSKYGFTQPVTLREKLIHFRTETYQQEEIKAYMVFTDAVLDEIVRHKPTTPSALKRIKNIQKNDTLLYSAEILEIIKSHIKEEQQVPESQLRRVLKTYRIQQGVERNIEFFEVFTDKMMEDIIQKRPNAQAALLEIEGFDRSKVREFGESIIHIVQKGRF